MSEKSRERREKWAKVQEARDIEGLVKRTRLFEMVKRQANNVVMRSAFNTGDWVVIDANPVYKSLMETVGWDDLTSCFGDEYWQKRKIPLAVPFDKMCIEFNSPAFPKYNLPSRKVAALAQYVDEEWLVDVFYLNDAGLFNSTAGIIRLQDGQFTESKWNMSREQFEEWRGYIKEPGGEHETMPFDLEIINKPDGMREFLFAHGVNGTKPRHLIATTEGTFVTVAVLYLLSCSNVRLVDSEPSKADSAAFQKHFGVENVKFKTLIVGQIGKRTDSDQPQRQFDVMPLHLRRGNFAHYTDDAPLFGKFTGTFWRPATVVGNSKNGVVVKDYKVLAPHEPEPAL